MSNRKGGFTLIELLVVVVMIGILASIAILKAAAAKDSAKLAGLKSDVHNIEVAQEAYYSDKHTYGSVAQLKNAGYFTASTGTTLTISANATGYKVTVKNKSISKKPDTCIVQVGKGAAVKVDGVMSCS